MIYKTQVKICVGAGGVGKTTVACLMGLKEAQKGKRVLVITVDPARRLFDCLGLKPGAGKATKVSMGSPGELFAFMPNLKSEWSDFLDSALQEISHMRAIKNNPFYSYIVDGLPGAFEIICSHILFREVNAHNYNVIILDTPPAQQSLNFFDVPKRMCNMMEKNLFRIFMKSRSSKFFAITKKLAFFSSGILEKTLERLIGSHFFSELLDFALTLDSLYDPLLKRVQAAQNLFENKKTEFTLVVRPTMSSVADGISLGNALKERNIIINQLVLNQVLPKLDSKRLQQELSDKNLDAKKDLKKYLEYYLGICRQEEKLISDILHAYSYARNRIIPANINNISAQELLHFMSQAWDKN